MNFEFERFFSKTGFLYKSSTKNIVATANFTFGLFLRKVKVFDCDNNCLFIFKQENLLLKILLNIIRLFYRPTTVPKYILYNNRKQAIVYTKKWEKESFFINIYDIQLRFIIDNCEEKDKHIVKVIYNNEVIVRIFKDKFRYGKKNKYCVSCENWKYDEGLLILIVALCDVIFFPERFRWSAIECDLN